MFQEAAIRIGAIYQLKPTRELIRIIAHDANEVMYDSWCAETSSWEIASLKRTVWYLRLPTTLLLRDGVYIRTEEYTPSETQIHRPDLPFSFAQSTLLEWAPSCPPSLEEFSRDLLKSVGTVEYLPKSLAAPAIYISPFGPKGSVKAAVLVESLNGISFTAPELLWQSGKLQAKYIRDIPVTTGVGIYRGGIHRQLPAYYIWGANNRAE